jgi:aminoglycoside 6'-N-acetyltransferase
VTLRPVRSAELGRLAEILREEEVARWFGVGDPDSIAAELIDTVDAAVFAIVVEQEVIGAIQYYEELDPEYRHAGMDVFLTAARHGEGLGPEALRVLARHLFDERGHHRLVIDPAVATQERSGRTSEWGSGRWA